MCRDEPRELKAHDHRGRLGSPRAGEMERLREAALEMVRLTREEVGCIEYGFSVDLIDPDLMRVVERWVDQAALDGHFASRHMAAFNQALSSAKVMGASVRAHEAGGTRRLIDGD